LAPDQSGLVAGWCRYYRLRTADVKNKANPHPESSATPAPPVAAELPEATAATVSHKLDFQISKSIDDVLDAWGLVYASYRRSGLIAPNPYNLHTTAQAIGPQTTVVTGRLNQQIVSTISTICDSATGLPLDTVYPTHLDKLRQQGLKLLEVGLFADRRDSLIRSFDAILALMRQVFAVGLALGHEYAVIGVHPRHVPFYQRYFAFDVLAPATLYPTVNNNPVVLLWLDLQAKLRLTPLPAGLVFLRSGNMPAAPLPPRFDFDPKLIAGSRLGGYLAYLTQRTAPSPPTRIQSA